MKQSQNEASISVFVRFILMKDSTLHDQCDFVNSVVTELFPDSTKIVEVSHYDESELIYMIPIGEVDNNNPSGEWAFAKLIQLFDKTERYLPSFTQYEGVL